MTNKQRQIQLDEEKWNESFRTKRDLSGEMPYCRYCDIKDMCFLTSQLQKDKTFPCAKAYNKFIKDKK